MKKREDKITNEDKTVEDEIDNQVVEDDIVDDDDDESDNQTNNENNQQQMMQLTKLLTTKKITLTKMIWMMMSMTLSMMSMKIK